MPIRIQSYQEKVQCDILLMGVCNIILGQPWLYDHDATLYGHSNSCSFTQLGKKIVFNASPPTDNNKRGSKSIKEKKTGIHLINSIDLDREISEWSPIWMLATKEVQDTPHDQTTKEVEGVLKDFQDVFSKDLSDYLLSLRDIQHVIGLVPGSILPNLSHYRLNPMKHAELQRQVGDLL